jgi:hypothetical protein
MRRLSASVRSAGRWRGASARNSLAMPWRECAPEIIDGPAGTVSWGAVSLVCPSPSREHPEKPATRQDHCSSGFFPEPAFRMESPQPQGRPLRMQLPEPLSLSALPIEPSSQFDRPCPLGFDATHIGPFHVHHIASQCHGTAALVSCLVQSLTPHSASRTEAAGDGTPGDLRDISGNAPTCETALRALGHLPFGCARPLRQEGPRTPL